MGETTGVHTSEVVEVGSGKPSGEVNGSQKLEQCLGEPLPGGGCPKAKTRPDYKVLIYNKFPQCRFRWRMKVGK